MTPDSFSAVPVPASLNDLNPEQRAAVVHLDGPLLILAGAGSGKTRVLTRRIAYMLETGHTRPYHVLAITFTNKAAREIKERLHALAGTSAHDITVGTFHSVCVRWLRVEHQRQGRPPFTIYDDDDQIRVVKGILADMNVGEKQISAQAIRGVISAAKNELITPASYEPVGYIGEYVRRIYPEYQKRLTDANAMDFDDLIFQMVTLLQHDDERRSYYGRRYRYIAVDEYQDTNHAQYMLVKLLAQEQQNLCVVGDDDQSIYGWRGADIRNILHFHHDYPEATIVKLEQNYRSTGTILDAAYQVVSHNKGRTLKRLWTANERGAKVRVHLLQDQDDEAAFIVREIQRLVARSECTLNECAVMYRTNGQSRAIENAFVRAGVPYLLIGGTQFYQRKEIKDALAYLRLLVNPYDLAALTRIINMPPRKIGTTTIEAIQAWSRATGLVLRDTLRNVSDIADLTPGSARAVHEFSALLDELADLAQHLNVLDLLDTVLQRTGYAAFVQDGTVEGQDRWANIRELRTVAYDVSALPAPEGLSAFLETVALVGDSDPTKARNTASDLPAATLITLHAAKGLEYSAVFIAGMEEGLFPHSRSLDNPQQMEEERRLAYVGITRARTFLYLLHTAARTLYGSPVYSPPSRFIEDISPDLIDDETRLTARRRSATATTFSTTTQASRSVLAPPPALPPPVSYRIGQRVQHKYFGVGRVEALHADAVTVRFTDGKGKPVEKTLDIGFVGMEPLDG